MILTNHVPDSGLFAQFMEWFTDEPLRGQIALTIISFAVATGILWVGRRRLALAVAAALAVLLLAAITIPSFMSARPVAQRYSCVNNLRNIQGAKVEWARTNQKQANDIPTVADLCDTNRASGLLRHPPICPRGGVYTLGNVAEKPTCSLSNKGHKLE
jgi:hypothetical protein